MKIIAALIIILILILIPNIAYSWDTITAIFDFL